MASTGTIFLYLVLITTSFIVSSLFIHTIFQGWDLFTYSCGS